MPSDTTAARTLMDHFAASTGLGTDDTFSRRYLWTDAFAVCNWLGLGEVDRARDLVGQVHRVLGRHREDDPRIGWISGLSDEEGERRPTAGGLRIGKPLPERRPEERYDPRLEWERDGQYFHYLTRWMRALVRVAAGTGEDRYRDWAVELARVAFDRFSHGIGPVPNRLHWKMSIDLTRPVLPSMGQHDPLDGYVALREIRAGSVTTSSRTRTDPDRASGLESRIHVLDGMGAGSDWITEDPLGAGALLTYAWLLYRSNGEGPEQAAVIERVIRAAALSLREVRDARLTDLPAARRLAFRELGLAIGLAAVERLAAVELPAAVGVEATHQLDELRETTPLGGAITDFWLDPENRQAATWLEHEDISTVMLATAVHPVGYLGTSE